MFNSVIKRALKEDIGERDITSSLLIPPGLKGRAEIICQQEGVIAGLKVAEEVFRSVDAHTRLKALKREGERCKEQEKVGEVEGRLRNILCAERVALNFLSRLSGIATLTARFVEETKGFPVKIMDTRKTTPNLRELEKYAVKVGGGVNHRFRLDEMILIKDNHIKVLRQRSPHISLKEILEKTKRKAEKGLQVEIEVSTLKEFKEAMEGKPDIIMLDNMSPEEIRKAVEWRNSQGLSVELEVSGGITLENVKEIARTGVERISIGALTRGNAWLDFSLEVSHC
ncbi:MAG: carboxylating nicotinate-nucleotide diphosphorylase [Candidatus Omnitrophota bacterium]|nr:MAG: carboxylating nicotinate-nucleotide diphosphorylase [Candidatus Omnitrophota bacterium]